MKVKKLLLREETEKVLHTKSNGDRLVANSSGHGYAAYTRNNTYIGHIEADTDEAAIAEFNKKNPKYESLNEDYLDSAEYRIQRYEDDIPDLFHRLHDGYMSGMVNARAYADVLAKIYSLLEELDYGTEIDEAMNLTPEGKVLKRAIKNIVVDTDDELRAYVMQVTEEVIDERNNVEESVLTEASIKLDPTEDSEEKEIDRSYNDFSEDELKKMRTFDNLNDYYDDDFDDLSAFEECGEVKTADALYGVERDDTLTEGRYLDTTGVLGSVGATYSDADLRKAWNEGKDSDPSIQAYNDDFDAWKKDTLDNMSKNEALDRRSGIDLDMVGVRVANLLDVDKLGEDDWIEFYCKDSHTFMNSNEVGLRFEASGADKTLVGSMRTNNGRIDVKITNGSEAKCDSAEEVARFIAGEFGVSI